MLLSPKYIELTWFNFNLKLNHISKNGPVVFRPHNYERAILVVNCIIISYGWVKMIGGSPCNRDINGTEFDPNQAHTNPTLGHYRMPTGLTRSLRSAYPTQEFTMPFTRTHRDHEMKPNLCTITVNPFIIRIKTLWLFIYHSRVSSNDFWVSNAQGVFFSGRFSFLTSTSESQFTLKASHMLIECSRRGLYFRPLSRWLSSLWRSRDVSLSCGLRFTNDLDILRGHTGFCGGKIAASNLSVSDTPSGDASW